MGITRGEDVVLYTDAQTEDQRLDDIEQYFEEMNCGQLRNLPQESIKFGDGKNSYQIYELIDKSDMSRYYKVFALDNPNNAKVKDLAERLNKLRKDEPFTTRVFRAVQCGRTTYVISGMFVRGKPYNGRIMQNIVDRETKQKSMENLEQLKAALDDLKIEYDENINLYFYEEGDESLKFYVDDMWYGL